jgi:hypothetical protein
VSDVERLIAKQEITEVLYRYCRGMDRMDRELTSSAWHPDGTAQNGDRFFGTGEEYIDRVWPAHGAMKLHNHQTVNILIEVDLDAGLATSESYFTAVLRAEPEPGTLVDIVSRGRYLDRLSRRDGRWALDHRQLVEELRHAVPVSADMAEVPTESRRDREDPSYLLASV